ncbi:MAG: transcriptional repressor [Bacteroidota bacterium]|nr:transcriptional repressor [Bacteroidota bacterium]MDE2835337.1 transcriptional repressor [Bacteroidota bacterium]MDE2956692.1 transcriptional repressor [Bacteroidota bacterium]
MPTLSSEDRQEVHRRFREFIKERGLRQTPERFLVLDAVYEAARHLDADELFIHLKKARRSISRGTVYNTLNLLMECDLVIRHKFGQSPAKYEAAYRYWQHDHLICLDCHHVMEFCDPRIQSIQEMVGDIYRFDIKSHALHLYGHCQREDCQNRMAAMA